MKLLLFAFPSLLLLISGCCCMTGPSCPTYTASCEKSCSGQGQGQECVDNCKSALQSAEGIDPDSCCPEGMTVRGIFETTCASEDLGSFSSLDECVNYMVSEYQNDFGLGPDDCTIGA